MTCRDVRDMADSFLSEELLTETNHEILRHLDTCPTCRSEIDARRRLRGALRAAFIGAPELEPRPEFTSRLREQLRKAAAHDQRSWVFSRGWIALAAGVVLAAGLACALLLNRSTAPVDALARDAIGDHRNCALKFRLVRMPIPLEEAAQRFDSAYRLLLTAPPDKISTPGGEARVVERHSCAYGTRRFGHVIMEYRGRVVSLLMTANDGTTGASDSVDAIPHVIGRPMNGLSVVSVTDSNHAILLVSDLDSAELAQLSRAVSVPLAGRLERHVDAGDLRQPALQLIGEAFSATRQ
ncbi:MAG TPA: zf-HC2 domain-containing protein [Vicinamibacterales bacterium]|nr:zf-HC2 domain-containing protein [Vicinamibacterales bacterium]